MKVEAESRASSGGDNMKLARNIEEEEQQNAKKRVWVEEERGRKREGTGDMQDTQRAKQGRPQIAARQDR